MRKDSFAIRRVEGRQATAVEARSAHVFARHSHDEYGIGVMLAGAQRSWSGRGAVEASAGDLITVNPGEVHDGAPIGQSRTWAMLYIAPATMTAIVCDIGERDRSAIELADPVVRDRRVADRFAAAYAALTGGADDGAAERLMLLIAALARDPPRPRPPAPPSIARAKARIDDDPTGRHPLDELAREAGASRFQTLRGFARLTGLTPRAYVIQRRLDMARAMIRRGASLAAAANAAGFADQSHFHRAFTRRHGLTPGAYAAAMR